MEKEFIPYEQALALKELGFNKPCLNLYHKDTHQLMYKPIDGVVMIKIDNHNKTNHCSTPTFSQAFRWFREKYNLLGSVYSNASGWLWEIHDNEGGTHRFGSEWSGDCEESGMFTSFEKAELECLKKLIELIIK